MPTDPNELIPEDLATILCDGHIESSLQRRLAAMIRQDPRFTDELKQLEALTADADGDDLWDGLKCNQDFDCLLESRHWKHPEEILNPTGNDLYEVSYRKLLAIAGARAARADDPTPVHRVRERLQQAEKEAASDAEFAVMEALQNLSNAAIHEVLRRVRRFYGLD